MALERKKIVGTSPKDIANINANMEAMWYKMFGNLSIGDINSEFLDQVNTQYITVQGEGNLDSTHPLYIRFYIPPNVKKLVRAPINIMLSRYRMDSSITAGGGAFVGGNVSLSTASQTVTASVASASATATATSQAQRVYTSVIDYWVKGDETVWFNAPRSYMAANESYSTNGYMVHQRTRGALGLKIVKHDYGIEYIDLNDLRHEHSVTIPSHSHAINIAPHSHSINISPHSHTGNVSINIPSHTHELSEGIKDSIVNPTGVVVSVNNVEVTNALSGDGTTINDLDIVEHLNVGAWNTIRVTSQNVSRITIYGIIEQINKFTKSR